MTVWSELAFCGAHRGVTGRADVDCREGESNAVTCIPRAEDGWSNSGIGGGTIRGLDLVGERVEIESKVLNSPWAVLFLGRGLVCI